MVRKMTDPLAYTHIGGFTNFGLCHRKEILVADYNHLGEEVMVKQKETIVDGQWREVQAKMYLVDCPNCKLLVTIMEANKFTPLFNSDQRKLAAEIQKALK